MSATLPAVVDEDQFLQCLTGEIEIDQDLLLLSMTQCEEALAAMAQALHSGSEAAWIQATHRARGFCGTMGFARAAHHWNIAEFEAKTPEARTESMTIIRNTVEELRAELRARGYEIPDTCISPS
jgi:hypothetical protein